MPTADSMERLITRPAVRSTPPPPPPPPPAPRNTPSYTTPVGARTPVYNAPSYGGGPSYSVSYTPPPPPPPPPNKDQWIADDAGYKAQRDALAKALADYRTNYDAEIKQYDVGYERGIRNLGWDYTKLDDPMTQANEGVGTWNLTDMTRTSGRSYQNQLNDFAARNLLQSTLYAQAVADLMRSLDEQLGNINMSRSDFRNDKQRALTAYQTDNESQRNLAYADAASRYSALFGV